MKRIVYAAALVAAMTAFTGCSNEEDLAQVTTEPAVKGTPFRVVLGNDTRANLSNTTTDNLSSFQLYGIQQTTSKNFWMDNVQFTKSGDTWGSASNPTWPVTNKETATNFYGFADGVTSGTPAGLTPSITADAQSFTFTFGDGVEHTRYYSQFTQTYINNLTNENQKTQRQGTRDGKKTTVTTLDANADRLTDLLVTYNNTTGTEGTNGTLNLNFKHALSNLVVKAMFVGDNNDGSSTTNWPNTCKFYIEWIRIYNLRTSGTYTFGSDTPWTFGDGDSKVVYEKYFGEEDEGTPDPRWTMDIVPYATYAAATDKKTTYQTIVGEGEFMAIPQTVSTFELGASGATMDLTSQCYIELCAYFSKTGPSALTSKGRGARLYFPLNVNNNVITAGKKQTVVIDLTRLLNDDGNYLATPSQAGGQ